MANTASLQMGLDNNLSCKKKFFQLEKVNIVVAVTILMMYFKMDIAIRGTIILCGKC